MNLRASLIELWNRIIPYDVSKDIYSNGENDQYSNEIKLAIANSPTALRAKNMLATYISGDSLTFDPEMDDYNSLWDVVRSMGLNIAAQGGVWIHRSLKLGIDGKLVTAKIKTLDYSKCKKGKNDDNDNTGRILYGDFAVKKGFSMTTKKQKWFYSFNDDQNVLKAQVLADAKEKGITDLSEALAHYRGQIMYINTTPEEIYAISPFDSVFNDMDTEYRISLYGNKSFRSGFLGKLMVFYSGLSDEDGKDFNEDIQKWLGAENSDTVYLAEVENAEEVDKSIFIKQVPTQYDDDISQNTEKRIIKNILGAANNLPEALLFTNDSAMFGSSGEMIRELKKFYNEQTSIYRTIIEKNLRRLGYDTEIVTIGKENEIKVEA